MKRNQLVERDLFRGMAFYLNVGTSPPVVAGIYNTRAFMLNSERNTCEILSTYFPFVRGIALAWDRRELAESCL